MGLSPGNVLRTSRGPVIIDWNDATPGSPAADGARAVMLLRPYSPLPELPSLCVSRYVVVTQMARGEAGACRIVTAVARLGEGIPEERERLIGDMDRALGQRPSIRGS